MITLIASNKDPIRTLYYAWVLMHWPTPPDPRDLVVPEEFMRDVVAKEVCRAGHGSTLEMVYCAFRLDGPWPISPGLVQMLVENQRLQWRLHPNDRGTAMVGSFGGRLRTLLDLLKWCDRTTNRCQFEGLAGALKGQLLAKFPWLAARFGPVDATPDVVYHPPNPIMSAKPDVRLIDYAADGDDVWYAYFSIPNWSRAMQQQLTRHRSLNFQFNSLRIMPVQDFADLGLYHVPPEMDAEEAEIYRCRMLEVQGAYRQHLRKGRLPQTARGILPLNIFSSGVFGGAMPDVLEVLRQRLCGCAQAEIRDFGALLRTALVRQWPFLESEAHCPCRSSTGASTGPCVYRPDPRNRMINK